MKQKIKNLLTTAVLLVAALLVVTEAKAQKVWSFEEVRTDAIKRVLTPITTDVLIEGFVVSDPTSENREHHAASNAKVIYFESLDGKYGFRCYIAKTKDVPNFPRYARMLLNLNGTTIE